MTIKQMEDDIEKEWTKIFLNGESLPEGVEKFEIDPRIKNAYRQKIRELALGWVGTDREMSKDDWMGKRQPKEIQKRMDDYRQGYNQAKTEIRERINKDIPL